MTPHSRLAAVHETLAASGARGRHFWRSLEELADDPEVIASLHREFPEHADRLTSKFGRRQFLELMGASLALAGAAGCTQQPQEKVVAFVRQPEQMVPGEPTYYATAMTQDGAAVGLLVESQMGRPIKVEGNPLHPAVPEVMQPTVGEANEGNVRFGATSAYAQAAVLSMYDPDRSQTVVAGGQVESWGTYFEQLRLQLGQLGPTGAGLRVLTETIVSPTAADQLQQLLAKYPAAQWHQYEPINRDQELLGSRLAFGRDFQTNYRLDQADVILSLDADFLIEGPDHLQLARQFANRRRLSPASDAPTTMSRFYMVETSRTLTGAAADHRLPLGPRDVIAFAAAIARVVGLESAANSPGVTAAVPQNWLDAVIGDLQAARGRSAVVAGRRQPPIVHALAHWLNESLGNVGATVEYVELIAAQPAVEAESLRMLADAIEAGEVKVLVILGGNPVFDAPADVQFAARLQQVPFTAHWGLYEDETSAACVWHLPAAHLLESWSDARACDGTASLVQPLIVPLYEGKTIHEILAALAGNFEAASYELVRAHWRRQLDASDGTAGFDAAWERALHDGVIAGTRLPPISVRVRDSLPADLEAQLAGIASAGPSADLEVCFAADPSVWDGRYANNGWLQELPRPFTKLTWDNAALLGPAAAAERGLTTGDVIELARGETTISAPVFVVPGHPDRTISLHVGYGRTRVGRVGKGVGANVYPLRTSDAMWFAPVTVQKTGRRHALATTQQHHLMDGRDLIRAGTWDDYRDNPEHPEFMAVGHHAEPARSMYPPHVYDGYKWGMVVNLSACTGCNACVVACQAENNIPVVGKDQVARGREMHWLRIDNYYKGPPENPATYHQPVMCMHCELAPCEVVCPVAATTHSNEGLNEMTYNRCVGTRYCSNNCPYKVRRFNFYDYNAALRQDATLQLLPNPDVTVRDRGVMEKCTYCVQRINAARIHAETHDRQIRSGEVVTACQAACPSAAIAFGNLNDADGEATRSAVSPLNYALLGDLNTRPRTTYLAAVRNPHPALVD